MMCMAHNKPCALAYSWQPESTASKKAHETVRNINKLEDERRFKDHKIKKLSW